MIIRRMKNEKRLSKLSMTKLNHGRSELVCPSLGQRRLESRGPWYCRWSFVGRASSAGRCLSIEDGRAKGSARSPESVNIFDALDPHRSLFVAFGGHAGAAGMTLEVDQLPALSRALTDYIREQGIDLSSKSSLAIDEELHLTELTLETLKSFDRLSPFGMDNKKPVFLVRNFKVEGARSMGAGNTHLKLKISQENATF